MASFCTQRPVHRGDHLFHHRSMKRHRTENYSSLKRQKTEIRSIPPPPGWLSCPNLGEKISCIIPSKTPLDETFDREIPVGKRYSFEQLKRQVPRKIGLVINLTNTERYYSVRGLKNAFEGIDYVNIPCRGHGSVPDNDSVNRFVYEVSRFRKNAKEGQCILVHCTHGFNRTGYMIVHYIMRTLGDTISVTDAIKIFAGARPPGLYNPEYIDALYAFYHAEEKPGVIVYPEKPEWKEDSVDEVYPVGKPMPGSLYAELVKSDGDGIPLKQQDELRQLCNELLGLGHRSLGFPGSHPVSLDLKNVELLKQRRYYATWKADGTRFMLLITTGGCFLIDRKFGFRRVEMRFPGGDGTHHMTLLDGEMVMDTVPETGKKERRFLVYDMMALNGESTVNLPFYERWKMVETEVIGPRNRERQNIEQSRKPWYRYHLEPFRVRRKGFFKLSYVPDLLDKFIPSLSHEADGLIFQGWDEPYVARADPRLLKWKPRGMNSVDFLFHSDRNNRHQLYLYDRGQRRMLEGVNRVLFEDGSDPRSCSGKVIECAWRKQANAWVFMRVRDDKDGPNGYNTFRKVMKSIDDDITKEMLLGKIKNTICLPLYSS